MSNCSPTNRVRSHLTPGLGDLDTLVSNFFAPARAVAASTGWGGAASVYEADNQFHLELDAPGVSAEQVDLQVENGQLTVTLDRPQPEDRRFAYNERRFGKVARTLELPDTVDAETIEANLTNGVLHVTIAKRPETQPRRIDVRQN
ncbi:MAG: Hsp20/alpha crystallin family protein [Planctomycetota bacterium]